MRKVFTIPANKDLVVEAETLLKNDNYVDIFSYHNDLNVMLNKIFDYRNETFAKAEHFLYSTMYLDDNSATVILNAELEKVIYEIFKKQQELFKTRTINKVQIEIR